MTKAVCNLARVVTNRRQMFLQIYILMDTIKEIELEQIFVPFIDYNKKNYIYHVFTFTLLLFFFFFHFAVSTVVIKWYNYKLYHLFLYSPKYNILHDFVITECNILRICNDRRK